MTRKKQTIIFLALIFIFLFIYMRFSGRHFTPEAVLNANELGLHYGPSEKVLLKYHGDENNMLVIGKVDERGLSVIPAKRSMLVFWKLEGGSVPGYIGFDYPDDRAKANYSSKYSLIYGITDLDEAAKADVEVIYKNNNMSDFETAGEYSMEIDGDGFFFCTMEPVDNESWYYIDKTVIYDKNGNVLFNDIN